MRKQSLSSVAGLALITSLGVVFCDLTLFAQNLVVNPSFEQTASDCANFGGESFRADLAGSWDNANSNVAGDSCSSPDLFAPCNTVFGFSVTGMPDNELGWQQARTGQRYVGIITHEPLSEYREYIQGRTSEPLVAGQDYCVSLFVSKADNVPFAANNLGVFFSPTQYLRNACPGSQNSLINETPQLNYDCAPIADTSNWVRVQWNYTATGGEQFFVIGNFFSNANTDIVNTEDAGLIPHPYAYYYIDDVSIVASEPCCYAEVARVDSFCVEDANFNLTVLEPLDGSCTTDNDFTWSGPGIVDTANGIFSPTEAGAGVHQVLLTLSCGHVDTTNIIVNDCQLLIVCENENGELAVGGGPGPYSWQGQDTLQDCSGCPFGFCSPICPGDSVTVWETYDTGETSPIPTEWPIRVLGANGSATIINGPDDLVSCAEVCELSVTIVSSSNICQGQNTEGEATALASGQIGNVTYSWNTSPPQDGATISGLVEGEYVVTVEDFFGCTDSDTVTIASYPEVIPFAGNDTVICLGDTIVLTATGGNNYLWETGDSIATISVVPEMTTSYRVWVTGEGNCTDSTTVLVMVDERICLGQFPNVISPGTEYEGDLSICGMIHQNNAFQLPCLEFYPENKVIIFDRWGRKRHEATNYHLDPWDGSGGANGVYYWVLELPESETIHQGFFHIVK